jgi:hypothetical protein
VATTIQVGAFLYILDLVRCLIDRDRCLLSVVIFKIKKAKFWSNPQFMVNLHDVDQDDNSEKCTIVVSLMQKDARLKRLKTKTDSEEFIQFKIFKVNEKHNHRLLEKNCQFQL